MQPGVAERFDSQLEGERSVLEGAGGAKVSHEDVDVPGATKAVRSTIESSGARSEAIDVLASDGRHLALAAGGPDGEQDALDADAVIASLRVEELAGARAHPQPRRSSRASSPGGPLGPRPPHSAAPGRWDVLAALLVAVGFGGVDAAVAKLALPLLSGAATVALLAWLAARPASEDSGARRRRPPGHPPLRRRAARSSPPPWPPRPSRSSACSSRSQGAFDSVRAPRELTQPRRARPGPPG